jgi:hypothetical protein
MTATIHRLPPRVVPTQITGQGHIGSTGPIGDPGGRRFPDAVRERQQRHVVPDGVDPETYRHFMFGTPDPEAVKAAVALIADGMAALHDLIGRQATMGVVVNTLGTLIGHARFIPARFTPTGATPMSKHTPTSHLAREQFKPLPLPSFPPQRAPTPKMIEAIARAEVRHQLRYPKRYGIEAKLVTINAAPEAYVASHVMAVYRRHGLALGPVA